MKLSCAAIFASCLLAWPAPAQDSWPQFRGPTGDGHAAGPLPIAWSETNHVRWKTAIHGKAWSSPVILGDQIWLTTATEDGDQLFALCLDRASGQVRRDLKVFNVEKPQFCHKFNSYASPTPVLEPGRVYVTFGSPGTACLDSRTGQVLWERRDFVCNHYRGAGSSPILYKDLLILQFDGSDLQYLVALDKRTGKTVWRADRSIDFKDLGPDGKPMIEGDLRKAFSTPHAAVIGGVPTLISLGAKAAYAYEPLTGKEIWRVEERSNHSASTRPVLGHGLIYAPSGFASGQLLAIRPGKPGEVLDAADEKPDPAKQLAVVWKARRNVPKKPSLLLVNDLLFTLDDGGIASCLEAKTGAEIWRERVSGNYSASPICAAGRIYCLSEEGKCTVLQAAREFKVLAENHLPAGFMASPAAVDNELYLRTRTHLYRIQE
jgi:outer membrane protein assembly factor BamB